MKKIIYIGICFFLFIISCNNKPKDDPIIDDPIIEEKIYIDESTIESTYYIDEFNITDFSIIYQKGESIKSIMILPTMVTNYPNELTKGYYSFNISYNNLSCSLGVNFIEKEKYTKGLVFVENDELTCSVVSYNGTDVNVIIPNTYNEKKVTKIDNEVFMNKPIETISLPDNLVSIGDRAFYNTALKKIDFNSSLETIGDYAFDECSSLRYVYLTNNIHSIGENAFYKVNKILIENETYPNDYDINMYDSNNSYVYLNINKDNLVNENNMLFYIDEDLNILVDYYGNSSSVETFVPGEENYNDLIIGPYCFSNHEELKNIVFNIEDNCITRILEYAFKNCGVEEIVLPYTINYLGDYAFSYCLNLTNFVCNNNLRTIPIGCFSACGVLETIYIPSGLLTIEAHAFQNCYMLSNTFIPISVTYIGDGAFYMNKSNTLLYEGSEIPSTWDLKFNSSNRKIYYNQTRDE